MMNKKMLFIAILAASLSFTSCIKDDINSKPVIEYNQKNGDVPPVVQTRFTVTVDENDSERYIVLGNKRNNPFALASINQAKTNLYGAITPDKIATHRYVKFLPNTQEHLAILEDWEMDQLVPLFDFPLEYEVVSEGEIYIDPSVTDSLFTYQYASVPIGVGLPEVPYEEIEDLYLDKSDPLLLALSFWLTGNEEERILMKPYYRGAYRK